MDLLLLIYIFIVITIIWSGNSGSGSIIFWSTIIIIIIQSMYKTITIRNKILIIIKTIWLEWILNSVSKVLRLKLVNMRWTFFMQGAKAETCECEMNIFHARCYGWDLWMWDEHFFCKVLRLRLVNVRWNFFMLGAKAETCECEMNIFHARC